MIQYAVDFMATNPEQPFNGSVFIDEVSGMYSYSKLIFPCSQLNEMLSRASLNENTIIHSVTMLDADEYAGKFYCLCIVIMHFCTIQCNQQC